jgi:hypothetical protein
MTLAGSVLFFAFRKGARWRRKAVQVSLLSHSFKQHVLAPNSDFNI